jgi:glycosyltransferase involved in cell wall biosynthesis
MGTITIGHRVHKKTGIPWIADFRDLPDEFEGGRSDKNVRDQVNLIKKLCKSASAIIAVTDPMADKLIHDYGFPREMVSTIANGFNEWDYSDLTDIAEAQTFDILHCGRVGYDRDPHLLLQAIDRLMANGLSLDNLYIRFYGFVSKDNLNPEKYACKEKIVIHDSVSRKEILMLQKKAALLLSLSSPTSVGLLPSKIFEYACIGRPVITIPADNNVLDDFVRKSEIGHVGETIDDIAQFILLYYNKWKETKKLPCANPNINYLEKYNRRNLAKKLAKILNTFNK